MKKKICCVIFAAILLIGITGCSNQIPELTQEQSDLIAEYSASLLLKYDSSHKGRILDAEAMLAEEEKIAKQEAATKAMEEAIKAQEAAQQQAEQEAAAAEVTAAVVNIAQFLELNNLSIDYSGVGLYDTYPEMPNPDELGFMLEASAGSKLVVVKFMITNTGSEAVPCDLFSKNIRFRLSMPGGKTYNAIITGLPDDMNLLNATIDAGQSLETALVMDVPTEEASLAENGSVIMRYNGNSATIPFNR